MPPFWKLVFKAALGRDGFQVQPSLLRRSLLDGGFEEIPIEAAHVLAVAQLPPLHRDPFDRLLVVQKEWEGLLLTLPMRCWPAIRIRCAIRAASEPGTCLRSGCVVAIRSVRLLERFLRGGQQRTTAAKAASSRLN
ncbi:MAG: hypothetical protein WCP63_05840 [Cyanobium sp. ELA712]